MKKHQEEMLFRTAANSYVEQEDAQIRKEMEDVEDVFKKMVEENTEFEKILEREFKKKNNTQNSKISKRVPVFYKVAVVLLVLTIGIGVSVMTVPALRNMAVDFVNYVTGRYAEVGVSKKDNLGIEKESEKNEFNFSKEYVMKYIPEGFALQEKNVTLQKITYNYLASDDSEKYVAFTQTSADYSINVDIEDAKRESIKVNGTEASLWEEEGYSIIIFEKEQYKIKLEGYKIPEEQMIKMAESIQ